MKFGSLYVFNLSIFDENGKFVTTLDSLQYSRLCYTGKSCFVEVNDALMDDDFLKFMGIETVNKNISDYDKYRSGNDRYKTSVSFDNTNEIKCKLIGNGIIRDSKNGEDRGFRFEIPNASFQPCFDWVNDNGNNLGFNWIFNASSVKDKDEKMITFRY